MNIIFSLIIVVVVSLGTSTPIQTTEQETSQISTADGPRYIVTDGD